MLARTRRDREEAAVQAHSDATDAASSSLEAAALLPSVSQVFSLVSGLGFRG